MGSNSLAAKITDTRNRMMDVLAHVKEVRPAVYAFVPSERLSCEDFLSLVSCAAHDPGAQEVEVRKLQLDDAPASPRHIIELGGFDPRVCRLRILVNQIPTGDVGEPKAHLGEAYFGTADWASFLRRQRDRALPRPRNACTDADAAKLALAMVRGWVQTIDMHGREVVIVGAQGSTTSALLSRLREQGVDVRAALRPGGVVDGECARRGDVEVANFASGAMVLISNETWWSWQADLMRRVPGVHTTDEPPPPGFFRPPSIKAISMQADDSELHYAFAHGADHNLSFS